MPPAPLLHPSSQVSRLLGDHHTLIRIRNLSSTSPLPIGTDAWGRPCKPQPVLISISVSLRHPFSSASETDEVTGSTVHYGVLSKAVLEICDRWAGDFKKDGDGRDGSLQGFLNALFDGLVKSQKERKEPVVKEVLLRSLEITVVLPKASLIGEGVSVSNIRMFESSDLTKGKEEAGPRGSVLKIHGLRIPTLIGVNPNERLAKQIVVANVSLDPWGLERDVYCALEEIVVKTIEESSFQTLEALATHLSAYIIKYFLTPLYLELHQSHQAKEGNSLLGYYPRIRISLEKPTAVTFAAAPVIEILVDEDFRRRLREAEGDLVAPPFPLQGRLDEWIKSQAGDGR